MTVCGPPAHAPFWQVLPDAQANAEPQPPQLAASFCSSTHAPLHRVKPVMQAMPHEAPSHVAVPCCGVGQAEHDEPHVAVEALLAQVPLQSCVLAAGHLHWPLWQVLPPTHANDAPQPPQFELSLEKSTQSVPHFASPDAQAATQERALPEPEQRGVDPEHMVVQLPHREGTVMSASHPSSAIVLQCAQPAAQAEGGNAHCPDGLQDTAPVTWARDVQSWPHLPQLCTSLGTQPFPHAR
jgi:hypothetical protein